MPTSHASLPAVTTYAQEWRIGLALHMTRYRLSTALAPHLVMRSARTGCKTGNMAELDGVQVTSAALQSLALVNYGHFTSMRVDNQRIRGLSQHLDRLVHDCRVLFNTFLDRERVRELIGHGIADEPGSFIARVTVFDPDLQLGHLGGAAKPRILVTTRSAGNWPATPMRVQSAAYQRESPEVKHVGLFGALWHRRQAELNGYDDAVFVNASSFISEGATWNIGFFDGDRVVWPAGEILPGITMRLLKQVHDNTVSAPVSYRDIPGMRAAFAVNTAVGVRAISAIDNIQLSGDDPIADTLRKEYQEIPGEHI
jgi:branched-subunit amino acid aminotransferase/4-amino-4-deoxychorismate lyase